MTFTGAARSLQERLSRPLSAGVEAKDVVCRTLQGDQLRGLIQRAFAANLCVTDFNLASPRGADHRFSWSGAPTGSAAQLVVQKMPSMPQGQGAHAACDIGVPPSRSDRR